MASALNERAALSAVAYLGVCGARVGGSICGRLEHGRKFTRAPIELHQSSRELCLGHFFFRCLAHNGQLQHQFLEKIARCRWKIGGKIAVFKFQ